MKRLLVVLGFIIFSLTIFAADAPPSKNDVVDKLKIEIGDLIAEHEEYVTFIFESLDGTELYEDLLEIYHDISGKVYEKPMEIKSWMVEPFEVIEHPLELEDWMTKTF